MFSLEHILPASERRETAVDPRLQIAEITDQSSQVKPGTLFFAIAGTSRDGHAFVEEALAKGAVAVVVEKPVSAPADRVIAVSSTRRALAAAWARVRGNPTQKLKVVGITGTNGKTTTTFLLNQVWQSLGLKAGLIGTVETRIGESVLPSTLTTPGPQELQSLFSQMEAQSVHAAAIEVSSIALDQHRTWGTEFEVVLFTNLTQDHLDYHGDFEKYYAAKRLLFTEYSAKAAVINIEDSWGQRLKKDVGTKLKIPIVRTFGFSAEADFYPLSYELGTDGTRAVIRTPAGNIEFSTRLTGRHNLANCLGALAACEAMGLEVRDVAGALAEAPGAQGRLERVEVKAGPSVYVDYAHSPDALANVLKTLREIRQGSGRIFTVFGCGGDRDRTKRPLMAEVASRLSDVTIATSDNPRTEVPNHILDEIETGILRDQTRYLREEDRRKAICLALDEAGENDIVLIAGKGHETYQILGHEKFPFDDRKVVREYYG